MPGITEPFFDALETRLFFASTRFAIIGDFGDVNTQAADVADLVHAKDPDFIITVGDNNYPRGEEGTIDGNIGRYYHDYIHPYDGEFGKGSPTGKNRFFPTLGNHDYDTADGRPYFDYFALPGNERYYTFRRGPVQFFALDSDARADGLGYVDEHTSTAKSKQGAWLKERLAASDAPYKIVYFHHPPYSSGDQHSSSGWMQWPFRSWGATAVIAGHDHDYERIDKNGTPFFVNGLGGRSFRQFSGTPAAGSRVRFTGDYGAMFVNADEERIVFKFVTRGGTLIDRHVVTAVPAAPSGPEAERVEAGVRLTWEDRSPNETLFKVQRSLDGGVTFETLGRVGANVTSFLDGAAEDGTEYVYRVRAANGIGFSDWSSVLVAGLRARAQ